MLEYGKEKLEQSGKPNARKKTNNKWFETQDTIAYWEDFSSQKLVWTPVNSEYRFTILDGEFYFNNSLFMITGEDIKYLCAIFNSKLFVFYLRLILSSDNYQYGSASFFSQIPIFRTNNEDKIKIVTLVNQIFEIKASKTKSDTSELESQVDNIIYRIYSLSNKEISFIETR